MSSTTGRLAPILVAGVLVAVVAGFLAERLEGWFSGLVLITTVGVLAAFAFRLGWLTHRRRTGRPPEPRPFDGDLG